MAEYTRGPVSDYQPRFTLPAFWARGAVAVMGIWLLLSAFVWPHAGASFTNTWVVGLGIFLTAVWTFRDPFARWVTVALGVWLFGFTVLAFHSSVATVWNNAIVACATIALSAVPNERWQRRQGRQRRQRFSRRAER